MITSNFEFVPERGIYRFILDRDGLRLGWVDLTGTTLDNHTPLSMDELREVPLEIPLDTAPYRFVCRVGRPA